MGVCCSVSPVEVMLQPSQTLYHLGAQTSPDLASNQVYIRQTQSDGTARQLTDTINFSISSDYEFSLTYSMIKITLKLSNANNNCPLNADLEFEKIYAKGQTSLSF